MIHHSVFFVSQDMSELLFISGWRWFVSKEQPHKGGQESALIQAGYDMVCFKATATKWQNMAI